MSAIGTNTRVVEFDRIVVDLLARITATREKQRSFAMLEARWKTELILGPILRYQSNAHG